MNILHIDIYIYILRAPSGWPPSALPHCADGGPTRGPRGVCPSHAWLCGQVGPHWPHWGRPPRSERISFQNIFKV